MSYPLEGATDEEAPRQRAPDPIDKYVEPRGRARRVGMRFSQTKLGDAIGVTFQQVQKHENGANRIGASNLFRIARALDVDVMFFYQDIPESVVTAGRGAGLAEPPPTEFERDPMSSRDSIELMHNYFLIPDSRVRRRLVQLVKSLARNVD